MNARYFYLRLKGYPQESKETGLYYYGYCNNMVTIHHKHDNYNWFVVHENGTVIVKNRYNNDMKRLTIDDLKSNDFELYDPVQVYKSGYIVLEDIKKEYDVKRNISKLYYYIQSFDDPYDDTCNESIPLLCGIAVFNNGVTDEFQFYTTDNSNSIELHLMTVGRLCKENVLRKHYDARVYPFNKNMSSNNSIYVTFVTNNRNKQDDDIVENTNRALEELLGYMKDINVKCKWIDCNLKFPISE